MPEIVWLKKFFFDKMTHVRQFFLYKLSFRTFRCVFFVSLKIIFTDSTEILFSKLRSAGLNFPLPKLSFFTDPYCAGGI